MQKALGIYLILVIAISAGTYFYVGQESRNTKALATDHPATAESASPAKPNRAAGGSEAADLETEAVVQNSTEASKSSRSQEAPAQEMAADTSTTTAKLDPDASQTHILQSPARPHGLDIIGYVKAAASDEKSRNFAEQALPDIDDFLNESFKERENINASTPNLTLEDMVLKEDSQVRVYFVKEGTVFRNSLGIQGRNDAQLIFPNASSAHSYYRDQDTRATEVNEDIPLLPGDFVDLGEFKAGELLDFFLIQDGAKRENTDVVFWADPEKNYDNVPHAKLHGIYDDNTWVIGFEDIPRGGDHDYNDLVIAVEITQSDQALPKR